MATDKQAILLELLVLRCKRGEKQALDQLICQWEGRLLYYVRRLVATEEDAWDVLQQTWIKVLKGIKTLDDPQRLPTWLYQIARRTAASHWRGHYREQARLEDNADMAELAEAEEGWHFEDAEQVHRALSRVSLAHREVLTLRFIPPAEEVPLPARIPVAVGALFSVGFAILLLRVFRRGSIDLKFDTSVCIRMVWGFAVLMAIMFMVMSLLVPNRIAGLWMMIFGLVVLVVGAVFLIQHGIAQSELRTREKLLEIEYRIAELAETAKPGKPKA